MNFENCGMVLGTGCGTPEMTKRVRTYAKSISAWQVCVTGGKVL